MEIIFNEEYLQKMYNTERTDKIHCFQPQIIRKNPYLFYTFAPKRKQQTWNYSIK